MRVVSLYLFKKNPANRNYVYFSDFFQILLADFSTSGFKTVQIEQLKTGSLVYLNRHVIRGNISVSDHLG